MVPVISGARARLAPPEPRAGDGVPLSDEARPGPPRHARQGRIDRRTLALHGGVIAGFLVIAIVMWWRVWITGHPTSTITCQCGDVSEALSYLAWPPWALLHGHNPFLSNAIYAGQGGANMLTNATWMAGGLLFAPVTWLFGPIATFNVAVTLAPVVSGWCFFLAVRKFTRFVPGQVLAAALWGFSPIMITSDPFGHFFQIWLFYPPLAFLCLYDLFVTRRHRPVPLGIAFGLLTVVQFFTGTEVLVICVVMGLIGSVIAAVLAPREAWRRRRHILVGLATAGATAAPLLAYPLWFALAGPQHIVGAAWPGTTLSGLPPLSVIEAGGLVHRTDALNTIAGYIGPVGPTPSFVGFGVVLFLALSAIAWYHKRQAWLLVGVGLCAWALSLGSLLIPIRAASYSTWLPWRVFAHLPVVSQVIPGRFCALTLFAVALLLAVSADSWWDLALEHRDRKLHSAPRWPARRFLRQAGTALSAVTAAALVPLGATYTLPYLINDQPTPAWFEHVAPTLTPGTVVLAYPYPDALSVQAMGWQAENAMRYRIVGGFAIVPGADGTDSSAISPFGGTRAVLDTLTVYGRGTMPAVSKPVLDMVRGSLSRWGVDVVVVTDQGRDPPYAAGFFTAVLGRLPRLQDGAWVWYGLGHDPPLRVAPTAATICELQARNPDGLALPMCVVSASHQASGSPPGVGLVLDSAARP